MDFSSLPQHHAVLITHSDRTSFGEVLWKEISALSPAHRHFNQTVLDIETARSIISYVQSPYSKEKVALISFHTATLPAQNAMLKVLEEPRGDMRFILLTTNKNNLIDTVLSRVQHVHLGGEKSKNKDLPAMPAHAGQAGAEEFLASNSSARMKLAFVVEILAKVDEEGRKDREAVKGFILSIVEVLNEKKAEPKYTLETLEIASYAADPSASGKALIEYLALLLPVIK
jgi:hypothetical protein